MITNSNNGRAIIYLRKSTDREDRQQISIETQRQHCEKLANDNGFDTLIIEDHKSAKEE
jgi:DNA invertase Pin-like site-specific DNA recombinase